MKKALSLLLVVIALFSVLTIAASAEAAPIAEIPVDEGSTLNVFFNLTNTLNAIGNWVEGAGTFLVRVFLEPIRLLLAPIVGFELV